MEPKDLKNSDELNSMPDTENNNSDTHITGGDENVKENFTEEPETSGQPEAAGDATDSLKDDETPQAESGVAEEAEAPLPEAVVEENENPDAPDEISEDETDSPVMDSVEQFADKEETNEVATDEKPDEGEDGEKEEKTEKQPRVTAQKVSIPLESSKLQSGASYSTLKDYSKLSVVELINTLRSLLDESGEKDIKRDIESIKANFYKKLKEDAELQKQHFVEEGGKEEDFKYEDSPYENDLKELLKEYRQIRIDYNKKLEQEKEINLQVKYEVIEEIKSLIHKEESINKTFQEFRELQKRWREIGLVPQSKVKDLWDTYHFHVENFYDYIKINQELRDLDLKKNLEIKIRLCEQAEELLLEPNVIKAFNSLQKLHERWREAGPVPRENKDDIWERFKSATTKINNIRNILN